MTLWGGRFRESMEESAWRLNASLPFDRRLAEQDVRGSRAWANALCRAGLLTPEENAQIQNALGTILEEFRRGEFQFQPHDEDIHTAVERRLTELIGPVAGKLHTGRSRNDQVATDFRLWVLEAIDRLGAALRNFQAVLVARAEQDLALILPGYTHLQRAQPILLSHWWLAHFWPLQRDRQRLLELRKRTAVLPLGSGALAGTPFPVDRQALAAELGFEVPCANSIDGVSDRDFAVEFLFCASLVGVHLARLCESLVIFTSAEFGFFTLAEAYSTGSSLMPQKKNPDLFELGRAKAGKLIGLLSGLLTTLKGLPSAYDKDLQEDKPPVFAAYDTLMEVLPPLGGAIATLKVNAERLAASFEPALFATDLADYLVEKGVPFRQAHEWVGQAVRAAEEQGITLERLSLEVYRAITPHFEADLYAVFDPLRSVTRRKEEGGTAPEAVQRQLARAKALL
ncbi:MAG: argininosuccinate lyase [Anaerolineales bacterium]|nr:argininosuccinate lyase [Anaerolineales bacterium]MDW8161644.1 argininosuccinate lyase [Anaerolineales bacterium]